MNIDLWPLIVYTAIVLVIVGTMLGLSFLLGQRTTEKATGEQFESGIVSVGDAHFRINVHFYITAILFIIFDLEVVFLFVWAVSLTEIGWFGFFAGLIFIAILLVGLLVEWRSGALDWRTGKQRASQHAALKNEGGVVNITKTHSKHGAA